jgi:hypothetical protein
MDAQTLHVMAGLVPAIHVLLAAYRRKTWMPATSAGMTSGLRRVLVKEKML